MTDFWEVFGRLMTNAKFRYGVYKSIPAGYYKTGVNKQRLNIPQARYAAARKHLQHVMPQRPISLMVAGELLMCISSKTFRAGSETLAHQIHKTKIPVTGRVPLFYAALGLMLLDDNARAAFGTGDFSTAGFTYLDPDDKADLQAIARANPVKINANRLCNLFWGPVCFDKFFFYINPLANPPVGHQHPTANDYPPNVP